MTQKVAMTFKRGHGVYNAGETAGFDADHAETLEKAGIAVKAKEQPKKGVSTLVVKLESPELDQFRKDIEKAGRELSAREDALAQRGAALDEREAELDRREAEIEGLLGDDAEKGNGSDAGTAPEQEAEPEKAPSLPKQGK